MQDVIRMYGYIWPHKLSNFQTVAAIETTTIFKHIFIVNVSAGSPALIRYKKGGFIFDILMS